MAKEKEHEAPKHEGEGHKDHKGKKMHLHEIRSVQAHDGSIVHHHTYKEHADHPHTMPEREAMATSDGPDEAGQHVQEQFAMNGMGGGGQAEEGGEAPAAQAAEEGGEQV